MLNSYQMMAIGHLFLGLTSHATTIITTVYLALSRLYIGKAPLLSFPYIATSLKSRRYYISKLEALKEHLPRAQFVAISNGPFSSGGQK